MYIVENYHGLFGWWDSGYRYSQRYYLIYKMTEYLDFTIKRHANKARITVNEIKMSILSIWKYKCGNVWIFIFIIMTSITLTLEFWTPYTAMSGGSFIMSDDLATVPARRLRLAQQLLPVGYMFMCICVCICIYLWMFIFMYLYMMSIHESLYVWIFVNKFRISTVDFNCIRQQTKQLFP